MEARTPVTTTISSVATYYEEYYDTDGQSTVNGPYELIFTISVGNTKPNIIEFYMYSSYDSDASAVRVSHSWNGNGKYKLGTSWWVSLKQAGGWG